MDNINFWRSIPFIGFIWLLTFGKVSSQGNPEFAEKALNDSLQQLHFTTMHDTLIANAYHDIGLNFKKLKKHKKAIFCYKRAIEIREKFFPDTHPDIIKGHNNIGVRYFVMNRSGDGFYLDSAEAELKLSINLNLKREIPTNKIGDSYFYLSRVARELGDIDNAILYLHAAITHFQNHGKTLNAAIAENDLSFIYATLVDDPISAVELSSRAISFASSGVVTSSKKRIRLGKFYLYMGVAHMQLRKLNSALGYYNKALSLKLPYQKSIPSQIASLYNNMGITHNRNHSYNEAVKLLTLAIELNKTADNDPELAGNYDNLGDAWLGLGDFDSANIAYQQAILNFAPDFTSQQVFDNPDIKGHTFFDPMGFLVSMSSKARTLFLKYQETNGEEKYLHAAHQTFGKVDSLIQSIRLSFNTVGSKESLVSKIKPIYEHAIETSLSLFHLMGEESYKETAFAYAEKSKSIILQDAIRNTQAIKTALPEDVRVKLDFLTRRRAYYEKKRAKATRGSNTVSPDGISVGDSVIKYRQLESDFLEEIKKSNPKYYQMFHDVSSFTTADIRNKNLLGEDQGMIEYFVGEDKIYAFLITADDFVVEEIKRDFPLEKLIAELRHSISSPNAMDSIAQYATVLHDCSSDLYTKLLEPFGDLSKLPRRLIIIRDDILGIIPFEVLLTEKVAEPGDLTSFPYLIKEKTISYAFSAGLLHAFVSNEINPRKRLVAFAPIEFEKVHADFPEVLTSGLNNLLFTGEEIAGLADLKSKSKYLKEKANLKTFLNEAGKYKIVYVASHGIVNDEDPRFNGIVFHDSILYTADLYQLSLNAEMVVLRACETGVGTLKHGEGIASLSRGFAQTGAKSIFSTQWVVPDASRFMEIFMRHIDEGKPKDEALHLAKLHLVSDSHPFYWAPYEIRGDVNPVDSEGFGWAVYLMATLMLLLVFMILRAANIRNRKR